MELMKLLPVHTVSSSHDPSPPDQGSSAGVVKAAARFVLKRDLMKRQQTALKPQETERFRFMPNASLQHFLKYASRHAGYMFH